ncbi:MAG: DUF4860 domain-containing protein [Suilimivivens sp.]
MNKRQENHIIDVLFVIALFCIFALSAVFLITIGANIYGKTVSHMESNFSSRTSFAYITEKIRQADKNGSVNIGEFDGRPALFITETLEGTDYITYLYEYDGYLKELMVRRDTPLSPSAGQDIMEISEFSLTKVNDKLFAFTIATDSENRCSLYVSQKSSGGDNDAE